MNPFGSGVVLVDTATDSVKSLASAPGAMVMTAPSEATRRIARRGDPQASMAPDVSLALIRVAQELVRNAVVHGRARRVVVTISFDGAGLMLAVEDDGVGLSRDAPGHATGGLRNARRWLADVGGSLEVVASNSASTTLFRAQVPPSSPHAWAHADR